MRASHGALLLALFAAPLAVSADPATDARFFDGRARAAFSRRAWESALEDFLLVQSVAPTTRNLYNAALSADAAGRRDMAFGFFEEYLAGGDPDEGRRAHATERVAALRQTLALVRIESSPTGATVGIDRAELGSLGPAPRVVALEPGRHTVLLEHEGHRPARVEVEARTGELQLVGARLEAIVGHLHVEAIPPSATVVLLAPWGEVAREEGGVDRSLPVGSYRVRLEVDGAIAADSTVRVREGVTESLRLVAPPRPIPAGRVLVSTGDVRATVAIDGTVRGTTPLAVPGVPAGRHRVRLTARGHLPWEGEVVVDRDRTRHVDVSLVRRR